MAVLTWLGFVFFLGYTHCYDNLSRQPYTTVTQSSMFENHPATLANDGNISTTDLYCSHTGLNHERAWFQVDLGKQYSLNNIKIFYRNDGNGFNQWKQYRFRQFYLDVSNRSVSHTTTAQRTRCYTDNTTYPDLPPNIIDIPCKHTARYVIVETTYDAKEDDNDNVHGAILEICEIEVYGCSVNCINNVCNYSGYCNNACKDGTWGPTCDSLCPTNCNGQRCARLTGHCNSCNPGYWGNRCETKCSESCNEMICDKLYGRCTHGCTEGYYGDKCNDNCSPNCINTKCQQQDGACIGGCKQNWVGDLCNTCSGKCMDNVCDTKGHCTNGCLDGYWGLTCNSVCSPGCIPKLCNNLDGQCTQDCVFGSWGPTCESLCPANCNEQRCARTGNCISCTPGYWGSRCETKCSEFCNEKICDKDHGRCTKNCTEGYYGDKCNDNCSPNCINTKCQQQDGACIGGCKQNWVGDLCNNHQEQSSSAFPVTEVGAAVGATLFVIVVLVIVAFVLIRRRRYKESESNSPVQYQNKSFDQDEYTNIGSISVAIEDPDEEPQIEKPEECVYYNNLSVAKDIPVSDLLNIITTKQAEENQGFLKEFKSLPYGERFPCDFAKTEENMSKNRFKTTFPYDHSRVVLESSKEFKLDYINANYIENMDGKREFIASQGPRDNTVVDHWRMIWQEHVNYIVMLTNLIEGPKVKCHQYWPEVGKEMIVEPFSLTLLEEKVYAYFVIRKMAVRKKRVTGSRTVVQFHYTRWPDHGTPNPLNLVDFLRQFRHKIKPSHHPILVHCSAGIGRTGTFIALDVLSRYGKVKGKINVIEYVKAMRKDRMTMIQNVDQYVFLYHALYEFFRRSGQFVRKDDFLSEFANLNKAETKKQLSDEFNDLTRLKTKYEAKDYKSGKKHQKLNASKSVLPVEKYLVYLTSHVAGRDTYYNAVNVSSFTQAEELISAQFPVVGAAIDLVRLLIDEDCSFLVSLNPLSEVKELKDWVNDKIKTIKLDPYEITKHTQAELSPDIRKTSLKIKGKEDDILGVEVLECMSWSSSQTVPADKSILINFIKEFCLDRKSHPDGRVAVLSKDGAVGCGVFCAVYNGVQQIQQDIEVDMFTIVRQLQVRRPEMISTVEEYELCYDAVHQFLASDSVYANT